MEIRTINGNHFEEMIKYSLQNMICFEEEINSINVFPISDGDTGTNMRFTLENGINSAPSDTVLGTYLSNLSKGMLFGARGNSGVILSQLFKGVANSLKDKAEATVEDFVLALTEGAALAHKSVVKPAEGTILTVTREGIRAASRKIGPDTDFLVFFNIYLDALNTVLEQTPDYLPVLKINGVLDSGGTGYFRIVEGMKKCLLHETINVPQKAAAAPAVSRPDTPVHTAGFTKDSPFTLGYCLEFILQILDSKCDSSKIDFQKVIDSLNTMGESLVAIHEDSIIKIHIHVMNPVPVIAYMLQFGEFVSFKLENMQLQHNELHFKEKRGLCLIAVANNAEINSLFTNLGCDYVISDDKLQNATSSDFINAINRFDAEHYVLLPNSKNLIPPARQAKEILGKDNITIIETTDIAQGYYSLAMDESESSNIAFRINQISEGSAYIKTLLVTTAIKNTVIDGLEIKNGDKIFIHEGNIIHSSRDIESGFIDALKKMDISDRSSFLVFTNDNMSDEASDKLADMINDSYPENQQSFLKNPNSLYDIVLGVF